MAVRTATKTGLWKDEATWGAAIPTSSDEVIIPTGIKVTIDAASKCRSLETTGAKPELSVTKNLAIGLASNTSFLKLASGTVLTVSGTGKFEPSTGTVFSVTTNGIDLGIISFSALSATEYKLLDKLKATTEILFKAGTLKTENQEVVTGVVAIEGASTKEMSLGSSTIKLTGTGTVWSAGSASGLTIKATEATIESTGATAVTFQAAGFSYNNVTFTGKEIEVTGGGSFTALNFLLTGTESERKAKFTEGKVITVTTLTKSAGAQQWASNEAGKAFKLKKSSGTLELSEVKLRDSVGEGGATFKIVNGENISNNSGWIFESLRSFSVSQLQLTSPATISGLTKMLTQGSVVTTNKLTSLFKSVIQEQNPSLVKGLTPLPLSSTQNQSVSLSRRSSKVISLVQEQVDSLKQSSGKTIAVAQEQIALARIKFSTTISLTQNQIVTKFKTAERFVVTAIQPQTATNLRSVVKVLLVTQEQTTGANRMLKETFLVVQSQVATVKKDLTLRIKIAQAQTAAAFKSLPFTFSLTQSQSATNQKLIPRVFSTAQEQALLLFQEIKTLEHFRIIEILVEQSQEVSFGKFTSKIVGIVQPITFAIKKDIAAKISKTQTTAISTGKFISYSSFNLIQTQVAGLTSKHLIFYQIAINAIQGGIATAQKFVGRTVEMTLQPQLAKVNQGHLVTINTAINTVANFVRQIGTTLTILQPQEVNFIRGLGRELLSGKLVWVSGTDTIELDPDTQQVVFQDGKAVALDQLGQYEVILVPGDPDILTFRLRKPRQGFKGTTKDPQWQ